MLEHPWARPIPQKGDGATTSNTKVELPDYVNLAAQQTLENAQKVAGRTFEANPNLAIAPVSADTQAAYDAIRRMQGGATGAYDASESALTGLLSGAKPITTEALTAGAQGLMNPYISAVVDPAAEKAREQLAITKAGNAAQAANVGAFGGSRQGIQDAVAEAQTAQGIGALKGNLLQSGWQNALTSTQSMLGTNLTAALQAAGLLPQVATAEQNQIGKEAAALQSIGTSEQQQAQSEQNLKAQQWQTAYDYPLTQQQILQSALQSIPYGSSTSQTTPTHSNQLMGALGGAATGAALGTAVYPGIGTAIGAVGGGLIGLFG